MSPENPLFLGEKVKGRGFEARKTVHVWVLAFWQTHRHTESQTNTRTPLKNLHARLPLEREIITFGLLSGEYLWILCSLISSVFYYFCVCVYVNWVMLNICAAIWRNKS